MTQNNYIESGHNGNLSESYGENIKTVRQRIGLAATALITAFTMVGCVPILLGQESVAPNVEDYSQLPPVPTPDLNPNDDPGVVIEPRPEGLFPPMHGPQLRPPTMAPEPQQNPALKTTTG